MENPIRHRVAERLSSLGYNPFEAARIAGLERSFINDLLVGKKQTVRGGKLPALAEALQCDQAYLLGIQPTPRAENVHKSHNHRLRIIGICEAQAFRPVDFSLSSTDDLTIQADDRFPAGEQAAYLVRGDHAAAIGVTDGSVICVALMAGLEAAGRNLRDRDAVLVRRAKEDLAEITARTFSETKSGGRLIMRPASGPETICELDSDTQVIGLILRLIRVF